VVNFGVKKNLWRGLSFTIEMPLVDNIRTEDLTPDQLSRLLGVLETESNIQAANIMKMPLFKA